MFLPSIFIKFNWDDVFGLNFNTLFHDRPDVWKLSQGMKLLC